MSTMDTPSEELDEDSTAYWLYNLCFQWRPKLETRLSALQISIKMLQAIRTVEIPDDGEGSDDDDNADNAADEKFAKALSVTMKEILRGKGIHPFVQFQMAIHGRASDLVDDYDLSDSSLSAVAAKYNLRKDAIDDEENPAEGGGVMKSEPNDNGEVSGKGQFQLKENEQYDDNQCQPLDNIFNKTDSTLQSSDGCETKQHKTGKDVVETNDLAEHINVDELICYQMRTRVLGLSQPTFTSRLWKYLQSAGWTYSSGIYHIPKKRKLNNKCDIEILPKRIFDHFKCFEAGMDNRDESKLSEGGEPEDEEGPTTFAIPNDLIDYLDQYSLPYPHETPAEIKSQQEILNKKPKAYERRCRRLRNELLEVAFCERLRKRLDTNSIDENVKNFSRYGHNHRRCDVCFQGPHHVYPRVACRGCGLVVHTKCYRLLDHGEISADPNQQEVDEMGLFTCDVCALSVEKCCKTKWYATEKSRLRRHSHPLAKCPLCSSESIAGGMIKIQGSHQKRSSRVDETWAHLFCVNSLPRHTTKLDVSQRIHDALDSISNHSQGAAERCDICSKRGVLLRCEGNCGKFFHALCVQIDHIDDDVTMNRNTQMCMKCGDANHTSREDTLSTSVSTSSKGKAPLQTTEEINQYFDRRPKKKIANTEDEIDLVVPTQKECIVETEALYDHSNIDSEYKRFEMQHTSKFRQWSFLLATNQSVLLYGLGSKRSVLTSFGQDLSNEGDVLNLDGYNPAVDLSQFFYYLSLLFLDGEESRDANTGRDECDESAREPNKGLVKQAAYVAKHFASTRSRPLFILVHNIDGIGLRNRFSQDALATLTADSRKEKDGSPMIRIVATVDNVNSGMVLWNTQTEHKFDWVSFYNHNVCFVN